jgi:cell division protein FtsQ
MRKTASPRSNPPIPRRAQRRKLLRRKRGMRTMRSFWQVLLVASIGAGAIWGIKQPLWLLKSPDQITIEGNKLLSAQSIVGALAIDYPQSLIRVEPDRLVKTLLEKTPLIRAQVHRRLIPPGLIIQVEERLPVALSLPAGSAGSGSAGSGSAGSGSAGSATKQSTPALLDEQGNETALDRYSGLGQVVKLPELKIIGMRPEDRQVWPKLYAILKASPVKILGLNWENPSNIILQTELGAVHIGPYSDQLSYQLQVLDRMRNLKSHPEAAHMAYIDLRRPTVPRLQMNASGTVSPTTESAPELTSDLQNPAIAPVAAPDPPRSPQTDP